VDHHAGDVAGHGHARTLELKQDGEKVTGTYTGRYGPFAVQGTVKGARSNSGSR
jgi:hypothetical protein